MNYSPNNINEYKIFSSSITKLIIDYLNNFNNENIKGLFIYIKHDYI